MSTLVRLDLLLLFSSVSCFVLCDAELKACTDVVRGKCFDNGNCNKTTSGTIATLNAADRSMTVRFPLRRDVRHYTVELRYHPEYTKHTVYKYIVEDTSCPCQEGEVTFYHIFKATYTIQIQGECREEAQDCYSITQDDIRVDDESFGLRNQIRLLNFKIDIANDESPVTTIKITTDDSEATKACGQYLVKVYKADDCKHRLTIKNTKVFEERIAINVSTSSERMGESTVRLNLKEGSYCAFVDVEDENNAFQSTDVVQVSGVKRHFTVSNSTTPVVTPPDGNLVYFIAFGAAFGVIAPILFAWLLIKSCRPPAPVSPENPPEAVAVAPGKILLLYGHDPNPRFNSAMRLLRTWLSEHCHCPVADVNDPEIIHDISNNWRQWLLDYLDDKTNSTRVVIVCCREVNHSDFRDGVYKWAVEMLQNKNDDSNKYEWLFVAKIEGYDVVDSNRSNIRLITPFHSFTLPGHLPNLVARLHGGDSNVEKYSGGKLYNAVSTELSLLSTSKCNKEEV